MALLLPNSVFIHVPKAGGSWVRKVLKSNGLSLSELGDAHCFPSEIEQIPDFRARAVTFCFVRHPLTWYRSYWAYKTRVRWNDPNNRTDEVVRSDDFPGFLDNVLCKLKPGHLSRVYSKYTAGSTFVGKQERLLPDLLHALKLAGEKFSPELVRDTPLVNASAATQEFDSRSRYPKDLIAPIMKAEAQVISMFGYDYIPDGILAHSGKPLTQGGTVS